MANIITGSFKNAAGFAKDLILAVPRYVKVIFTGNGAASRISHLNPSHLNGKSLGAFAVWSGSMAASGFGIKGWYERREHRKDQEMMTLAPEAGELQENIRQNKLKLIAISNELGRNNPTGHFRETIRGGDVAQGQPNFNP